MINEQEIEEIIEDFWEQNLKFRIWSSLYGADEKNWVLDLKTLQTDYDNIGLRLYEAILEDPEFTIQKINEKLQKEIEWDNEIKKVPQFKIMNAPVYDFSKININTKLVEVHGVIKSLSQKLLNYVEAVYECNACGFHNHIEGLHIPKVCQGCGKKGGNFTLITEESKIEEYRELKIQEIIDVPKQVYDTLLVEIPENLLNNITLGDRVAIVGIPQVKSTNQNSNKDKRVKEIFIKALNIYKLNDEIKITQEDIEKFKEFSKREDLLDALAEMYAPAIIGHLNIKKAIILQAVGGIEKFIGGTRKRGNIHILLIGDPGTAKSQLLRWHHNIMPKSLYVSGASGPGLTIAFTKNNNDHISWEAGVMVLANNSVACIDELEKMKEEDRRTMHTAMEQGVVSMSKAGIYVSATANTSVLAGANPKFSKFDITRSLIDQINLLPTILNRFDLIFFTIDQIKDEKEEIELAKKILMPEIKTTPEFLAKYIEYAKNFKPELTMSALNYIAEKYAKIRVSGNGQKIPINTRNLEAVQRLAEANAKLRLDNMVTKKDVDVAFSLMNDFLEQIGYDLNKLNIPGNVTEINNFLDLIRDYNFIDYQKMRLIAETNNIENLDDIIEALKISGDLIEKDNGFIIGGKNHEK
ncbi:MAG: minichromosome maintenance protein MCM [Thermoplasmata archaeon]|nr:AAA domain-containing protein [Euryarchaeota archaeon]